MPTPRTHRVTPVARPDGCDLDVTGYATDLLRDFINLLAGNAELAEDFDRLLNTDPPKHDRHERDVASRDDRFIADALAAMGASATAIRLHRPELTVLADDLDGIRDQQAPTGPRALPQQRTGEAA